MQSQPNKAGHVAAGISPLSQDGSLGLPLREGKEERRGEGERDEGKARRRGEGMGRGYTGINCYIA